MEWCDMQSITDGTNWKGGAEGRGKKKKTNNLLSLVRFWCTSLWTHVVPNPNIAMQCVAGFASATAKILFYAVVQNQCGP